MNAQEMRFIVMGQHRNEYPDPIIFVKGTRLMIGELYKGPENWNNWYFCTLPEQPEQPGGWVPAQMIEWTETPSSGIAKEDYTAWELDVNEGDVLTVSKSLNGWMWCKRLPDEQCGWVPETLLQPINADRPNKCS